MINAISYVVMFVIFGAMILFANWLDKQARRRRQLHFINEFLCAECGHPRLKHIPVDGCTITCDCPWDGNS